MSDLNRMDNKDINRLHFIYDRMKNRHGENENVDYMILFKKTIDKVKAQANEDDTRTEPALHKHIVNRWAYLFDNWQPIMLGIAMALAFNVIVTMFENVIVKIALIIHGG